MNDVEVKGCKFRPLKMDDSPIQEGDVFLVGKGERRRVHKMRPKAGKPLHPYNVDGGSSQIYRPLDPEFASVEMANQEERQFEDKKISSLAEQILAICRDISVDDVTALSSIKTMLESRTWPT